jgi:hypothetical protein
MSWNYWSLYRFDPSQAVRNPDGTFFSIPPTEINQLAEETTFIN